MARIVILDATQASDAVSALADILLDCVEGGASVSFMLPISRETAEEFWRAVAQGVTDGDRHLLAAYEGDDLIGTVQVVPAAPENQPHRGDISKMLVKSAARGKGTGAALMLAAEEVARQAGLTLLMLDTTTGMQAERLYTRLGWTCFGQVPGHALMPDGAMSDTSFFYKAL